MFRGATNLSIDSKGRMTVPSKHRDALTKLVIAPNPMPDEKCLLVYSQDEWEKVEADIVSKPNSKAMRRLKRVFIGAATEHVVDGQGRVLISPELREYAELEKKITLVGQGNKLEIWSEAAWAALNDIVDDEEAEAEYIDALEELSF